MSNPRKYLSLAALAVPLAVLAGCGGSAAGSSRSAAVSAGGGQQLELTANPSGALEFSPSTLTAKPGKVTIVMTNPSSTGEQHGIAIKGNGVDADGPVVGPGETSTVTATLKRGTYEFYCPFDHHAQAGMTGTLSVR